MASESFHYPYTRLFVGSDKVIATSGPHIQVFDSSTGEILYSTSQFTPEQQQRDSILKSGPIRCITVAKTFKYLAEVGEDKFLKVWEIGDRSEGGLKLINTRELPKKPTSILFTDDFQTILVSDKFGDVFSYPLVYVPPTASELEERKKENEKDPYASHSNPSNGALILGHASPLNAMLLARTEPNDEEYIITADRDEHIRVSWYPKGYNIEMYCLGHLKFVSALHIPRNFPSTLISGGGDPVLKLWDWMTGQQKGDVAIAEAVEPYIVVKKVVGKQQWAEEEDEEGGDGGGGETGGRGKKGKGRRGGKRKGKGKEDQAEGETEKSQETELKTATMDEKQSLPDSEPQKISAIRRIESISDSSGLTHVLFSAIGATALFSFPFPSSTPQASGSSSTTVQAPSLSTAIRHLDFGKPIIDFTISASETTPLIWVLLDAAWNGNATSDTIQGIELENVRLVTVSSTSGELSEVSGDARAPYNALLQSITGANAKIPATAKDLKSLDLYSELLSLPKFVNQTPASQAGSGEGTGRGTPSIATASGTGLTKRELGRLKRTAKVDKAKIQVFSGGEKQDAGDEKAEDGEQEEMGDEPETKRARSEGEKVEDKDVGDVVMS